MRVMEYASLVRSRIAERILNGDFSHNKLRSIQLPMHATDQFEFVVPQDSSRGGQTTNGGGMEVRATHLPTGLSVTCDLFLSVMQNRRAAHGLLQRVVVKDRSVSVQVLAAVRWMSDSGELTEKDIALLRPARVGDCTVPSIDRLSAEIVRSAIAEFQSP